MRADLGVKGKRPTAGRRFPLYLNKQHNSEAAIDSEFPLRRKINAISIDNAQKCHSIDFVESNICELCGEEAVLTLERFMDAKPAALCVTCRAEALSKPYATLIALDKAHVFRRLIPRLLQNIFNGSIYIATGIIIYYVMNHAW